MFSLTLTGAAILLSVYFFWRFRAAFRRLGWWYLPVAAVLMMLACGRILGRLARRSGWEDLADVLGMATVFWLVLLFWFLTADLALGLWNAGIRLAARWRPNSRRLSVAPRAGFLACAAAVLLASVWGWFEASNIRVNHVTVELADLPPALDGIRIAQITDLHVGSPRSRQRLEATIARLGEIQFDLLVSTGDLVDGDLDDIGHLAERLAVIHAPLGKYAVFGNHDFYAGPDNSLRFHQDAGFQVLRQASAIPAEGLRLVGVDDPAAMRFDGGRYLDEMPVLDGEPRQDAVLLLKHRPQINQAALGRFDLQLSGHTHGGQVFPFGLLVWASQGYWPGLHELGNGSRMWLSRGTGTWGPPLRLASPPEITLIELRRAGAGR